MEQLILLICKFLVHLLIDYFPFNILISIIFGAIFIFIFRKRN